MDSEKRRKLYSEEILNRINAAIKYQHQIYPTHTGNVFHICGYCNTYTGNMEQFSNHLRTIEHKRNVMTVADTGVMSAPFEPERYLFKKMRAKL